MPTLGNRLSIHETKTKYELADSSQKLMDTFYQTCRASKDYKVMTQNGYDNCKSQVLPSYINYSMMLNSPIGYRAFQSLSHHSIIVSAMSDESNSDHSQPIEKNKLKYLV